MEYKESNVKKIPCRVINSSRFWSGDFLEKEDEDEKNSYKNSQILHAKFGNPYEIIITKIGNTDLLIRSYWTYWDWKNFYHTEEEDKEWKKKYSKKCCPTIFIKHTYNGFCLDKNMLGKYLDMYMNDTKSLIKKLKESKEPYEEKIIPLKRTVSYSGGEIPPPSIFDF